ncbi:MAG: trigger factor [Fibrobacter sp.]|mgnify:CR=1 FL=1|nr:trigger factor [Fibrobacter sp.]
MKATVSEPESWKRILEIEIPEQEVQSAFDQKLSKVKKDIKLPGFRPGKIPLTIIKQRFGGAIRAEVVDELIQKSYKDACDENKITPVSPANVTDMKAPEWEAIHITVETQVDPEIEIKGYDKLKVKSSPKKIKDSDVDDALSQLRERFAEFKDVEREAKKGDFLSYEYLKVSIDGQERPDIKNPNYPIELGGENRIKDFDKGLIGHSANDIVDLDINFPEDYPDADVAGKGGQFQIKIIAVQEKVLPELNEEFFKKLGGEMKDEAGLREQLKKNIEEEEKNKAKNEAYNKAIDKLIENNPFEVPPARVEQFIDYMQQEATRYQRPGTAAPTREELESRYNDTAVRSIKRQRIIEFIADKENIKATQEEVDKEIQRLADIYNQPFEELKQNFRKNGTTLRIRDDLKEQKTLDYLIGEGSSEVRE